MAAAMVYWVWKARKEQIFKNKTTTLLTLVQLIWNDGRLKLGASEFKMKKSQERDEMHRRWRLNIQEQHLKREWTVWRKLSPGFHMLNSDGSLWNKQGFYGAIIRNHEGRVLRETQGKAKTNSIDSI